MTADDVSAVVQAMTTAWNDRDLDVFLSYMTDDVVWSDPAMTQPARGREQVRSFGESVLRAFPDFRLTIRTPICISNDGTRCAVPWKIEGTHSAPLEPPGYGPTGRKAVFEGVDLLELRGGRVHRIDTYFDVIVAAEQLLAVRLRAGPGGWRERLAVSAQRLRAAWLRRFRASKAAP